MSDMHPLQAIMDGMSAQWQRERADTQMTLGALIALLDTLPASDVVVGLGSLMSYRGYYCDLAFEPNDVPRPVADLLKECRDAMGREFTGYKGGEFLMGERTPLWVAGYGESGAPRLMGVGAENPHRLLLALEAPDEA